MYDVIVVGARCAGSPTAMLLARTGLRVLLVDRATFPSFTLSSHHIHHGGAACLHRWGLLDEVKVTGCPPIRSFTLDTGPVKVHGVPPAIPGGDASYSIRRFLLDKILVDAAARAGVEVREAFSMEELIFEGDRVAGIRGKSRTGKKAEARATLVIGADGRYSRVAQAVNAPVYNDHGQLTCNFYSYWSGLPVNGAELYIRDGLFAVFEPTNFGLTMGLIAVPASQFHQFGADLEHKFYAALERIPALAARIRVARREQQFHGTNHLPNYFRRPFGPGWALVGDAGYNRDPISAQGMMDAFRTSEMLAEAVMQGFSGALPLDVALARYERRRNELVEPAFEAAVNRAKLAPLSDAALERFHALAQNPEQASYFFGLEAGTVPYPRADYDRMPAAA